VRHVEFFDTDHFENNYHRIPPPAGLAGFIDFFWETRFEGLWAAYPKGFSDIQFPNIGYTNIINLGTPFTMQVGKRKTNVKGDGFLPRHTTIECFHKPGNHLFGIKFRISPVILKKKINFSEYRGYIYPLSYLMEQPVIEQVKKSGTFEERANLLSNYFLSQLAQYHDSLQAVHLVRSILDQCFQQNQFFVPVETIATRYQISARTLQRYFEMCTGSSSKQALQVMRIRKATAHLVHSPNDFDHALYGYYDHSHFYKHLKQFVQSHSRPNLHLPLLNLLHTDRCDKL